MKDVSDLLSRIERLMYGFNYVVILGTDIFAGTTEADFHKALKNKYPNVSPSNSLTPIESSELLHDIVECFKYRGDKSAGLILNERKEKQLNLLQQEYLDYVKNFFNHGASCFQYPSSDGIYDSVFWEYSYVLFTGSNIIFIYGYTSD